MGAKRRLMEGNYAPRRGASLEQAQDFTGDARDDRVPIAGLFLAKELRGRIPGTVIAIEEPAPVGRERQEHPDGLAQGAREVRDGGVDGNHDIELLDDAAGVEEVLELFAGMTDGFAGLEGRAVAIANLLLQAHERPTRVAQRHQAR